MNEQRPTNPNQFQTPYAANPTAPAGQVVHGVGVTPSVVGVKPDARLANAFLSQAFLWMFAGLFVTAGVAYFVQSNPNLLAFARGSGFLLIMVQLGIALGIMGAINRISATVALGLFFVYAATLGSRSATSSLYTTGQS
jgi:FtsH-binding integral membrane protein